MADSKIINPYINTYLNHLRFFFFNAICEKYNIKPSRELLKLQLTLAMSHGITLELCKNDYLKFTNEVIEDLFHLDLFM